MPRKSVSIQSCSILIPPTNSNQSYVRAPGNDDDDDDDDDDDVLFAPLSGIAYPKVKNQTLT